MTKMKYSMMSYTMSRQPKHFDLKAMLDLTRELDLDGIDLVTLHDTPAAVLRKMCDDRGIPVVCYTFMATGLGQLDKDEFNKAIDICKCGFDAAVTLGAPTVMLPTPSIAGVERDTLRSCWINGLREVAPLAKDAGVMLTIENFPGAQSPFVIADDILQAVSEVPSLRLTYDNGNAATGEEPVDSFSRCADLVVHVHFKDWYISNSAKDGYRQMLDGRYYKSALIGEGDVDQPACLAALAKSGYSGCINIEYEGNDYDPATATRRAVDYLRQIESVW